MPKIGQIRTAKTGLAKVGPFQSRHMCHTLSARLRRQNELERRSGTLTVQWSMRPTFARCPHTQPPRLHLRNFCPGKILCSPTQRASVNIRLQNDTQMLCCFSHRMVEIWSVPSKQTPTMAKTEARLNSDPDLNNGGRPFPHERGWGIHAPEHNRTWTTTGVATPAFFFFLHTCELGKNAQCDENTAESH